MKRHSFLRIAVVFIAILLVGSVFLESGYAAVEARNTKYPCGGF